MFITSINMGVASPVVAVPPPPPEVLEMAMAATRWDSVSTMGNSLHSLSSLRSLHTLEPPPLPDNLNPQQQHLRLAEHLFSDDVVIVEETVEDTPREFYYDDYKDNFAEEEKEEEEEKGEEEGDVDADADADALSVLTLEGFDEELLNLRDAPNVPSFKEQEQNQKIHEKTEYFGALNEKKEEFTVGGRADADLSVHEADIEKGLFRLDASGLPVI